MTRLNYRGTGQDDAQEMEGKLATADVIAWPGSAWVLFSYSPFPVRHPDASPCTVSDMRRPRERLVSFWIERVRCRKCASNDMVSLYCTAPDMQRGL